MGSDEPRDEETPEGDSYEDALLEPGPRRSTYTPPPQFIPPRAEPPVAEPVDEPTAAEPAEAVPEAPYFSLDDPFAPPVFDTPAAADFSSIFPDPEFTAPPLFPQFPDPVDEQSPSATPGEPFDVPEFAPPPAWPSAENPPTGFPASLADAPPPTFAPPGGADAPEFDPTVFVMPPPDLSGFQPPVYKVPAYESPIFDAPSFDPPPAGSTPFDVPAPAAERPWYEQEADDEQEAARAAAASVNLADLENAPPPTMPGAPVTSVPEWRAEPTPEPTAAEPAVDMADETSGEAVDEATLLSQLSSPAGEPWIPRRRSLPDDILAENLAAAVSQPGMTLDAMDELERQMTLRDQEAREYQEWEQSMLAVGTPEALEAVERVRPEFEEIVAATTSIPIQYPESTQSEPEIDTDPEPEEQPRPAASDEFDWNPVPLYAPELDDEPPALIEPPDAPPPPSLPATWAVAEPPVVATPPVMDSEPDPFSFSRALPSDESYPTIDPFADLPSPVTSTQAEPEVAPIEFREPAPLPENFENLLVADGFLTAAPEPVPTFEPAQPEHSRRAAPVVVEEPTPTDRRVGKAVRLFWLWFAANSSIVSVAFGAVLLGLGMSLRQAIIATLAGVVLSFIPLGLGTLAGKRSGEPTMVVSRATFGIHGNIVPAVLALVTRLFWGAALLWVLATSVASILDTANLEGGMTRSSLVLICLAIGFVIAVVIAYFGYGIIAKFQLVISILSFLLIAGFIAMTWNLVDLNVALQVQDGPITGILAGAVLVFSFVGLVWANASSDVAKFQSPTSSGAGSMLWATFGTALPAFALIAYGALLAASNPTLAAGLSSDPMAAVADLLPLWYPIPLIAGAALSLLSGVVISIYSGSFALAAVGVRSKQSMSTLLIALLTLGGAFLLAQVGDFSVIFTDLATTLAVPVAAWAGLFAAEVMIRNRPYDTESLQRTGGVYPAVRPVNLVAFFVITAVGFGLTSSTVSWLSWQGYIATPLGVPVLEQLAGANVGVVVALLAGLLVPIIGGIPAIRRQEATEAPN